MGEAIQHLPSLEELHAVEALEFMFTLRSKIGSYGDGLRGNLKKATIIGG
jgi:hypothetical protein